MILNYKEKDNYQRRRSGSLLIILIFSGAAFIITTIFSNWQSGLGFFAVIFLVQYFKSESGDKYYITSIDIRYPNVEIAYDERGEKKNITGSISQFQFFKKNTISKTRVVYLAIYYDNNSIIKQFVGGDWDENKIDEVIEAFKNTSKN